MAGLVMTSSVNYDSFRPFNRNWANMTHQRKVAVVRPVVRNVQTGNSSSSSARLANSSDQILPSLRSHGNAHSDSVSDSNHRSASDSSVGSTEFISDSGPAPDGGHRGPSDWQDFSSFFYPDLTMLEAKRLLQPHPVGTFLLRNSSEPCYAYSLSVRTRRGTTSVRILRLGSGHFRLDSDPTQLNYVPSFATMDELIRHYLEQNRASDEADPNRVARYVFLESTGRMDTPVLIHRPLLRTSDSSSNSNNSSSNSSNSSSNSSPVER